MKQAVTVRKKRENPPQKSSVQHYSFLPNEEFIHKMIELVPGLVAVYNINTGEYLYVNDSVTKILGYPRKDWLTKGLAFVSSLVHPDDVAGIAAKNMQALKRANSMSYRNQGNNPIVQFEYRLRHKNGSWRWLKTDGVVFSRDKKGKVACVMNISVDITERKEAEEKEIENRKLAEEALRDSESQLRAVWEAAADAIVMLDENGTVLLANKAYFELYGYNQQEVVGKNFAIIFPQALRKSANIEYKKLFLSENNSQVIESKIVRKDGSERFVASRFSTLKITKGTKAMLSIIRDITNQKRLEQDKNDFISIATHELKTPVTSIKAYAEVLERKFTRSGDFNSADHLGKMNAQLDKLTSLISDLLDATKIESGQLKMHQESFDFDELATEIAEELQRTTEKHTLILSSRAKKKIRADRERVGQVLTNLISNAIKYSPHTKKIIITSRATSSAVQVCVQDYGVGIPKAKQGKLFERFYRVSGPKDNTFPGLGLGLYISSEIIKRQGGRIWVESTLGKGSNFCFSLPVKAKKMKPTRSRAEAMVRHS